jgi:hypothetical protein
LDPIRVAVFVVLMAILVSLGTALFHLARGGDSARMARALTVRIVLSIVLFLLLMLAWRAGLVTPHGLR